MATKKQLLHTRTELARIRKSRPSYQEKARQWDGMKSLSNLPPMLDPNFRWLTMEMKIMTTREMSTWHLFNCLKMIWNNTVPEWARVGNFKAYPGIEDWPSKIRRHAVTCLFHELAMRPDITEDMRRILREMMEAMSHLQFTDRRLLRAP